VVSAVEVSLLENLVVKRVESCLADRWTQFARSFESGQIDVDWTGLQIEFEQAIQRLVRQELRQSNPSIVIMLQNPVAGSTGRNTTGASAASAGGTTANGQEAPGRRRQRSTAKVGS
jgi:ribonuclease J